jgi:D-glycero-D-manno-heptose 1,7-bisphosphate phosphatase
MNKAVFLDRDGVINHDPGDYTKSWEEFSFNEGLFESLRAFREAGYLLVIITNQGGIAKGLYTQEDYEHLTAQMLIALEKEGIHMTDVCHSPHHEVSGRSLTRKPGSLLIERALYRYNIDPNLSYMIGDKERDIFAGEQVGLEGILIPVNGSLNVIEHKILQGR